jgi:hypothetical protein
MKNRSNNERKKRRDLSCSLMGGVIDESLVNGG